MFRKGKSKSIGVAISFGVAIGCQPELEPVWKLTDYRVLGVRTDPAGPAPGERVMLSLVTLDVRPRSVQTVWWVTANPGMSISLGLGGITAIDGGFAGTTPFEVLNEICKRESVSPGAVQCGVGSTMTFTVPEKGGASDASGRESLSVVGYTCAGGTIAFEQDSNMPFACTGVGAKGWQFIHTIVIHGGSESELNPERPNKNPRIDQVRFGLKSALQPITLQSPPTMPRCADVSREPKCTSYEIQVNFSADSRETYQVRDLISQSIQPRQERLTTGFVVDRGRLAGGFRTDSTADPMSAMQNDYYAPLDSGTVNVYIYVSDGRGGFDWTRRQIVVQ